MKLAVMQPYIFPYVGYFQLIKSVDKFLFFDDVNFIKRGYINRNHILINGKANLFSIPLKKASQNKLINQVEMDEERFRKWQDKFLKSLQLSYKKAPHFDEVFSFTKSFLNKSYLTVSDLASQSVMDIWNFLGLSADFGFTSEMDYPHNVSAQEKIFSLCEREGAEVYINPKGGRELYDFQDFEKENRQLFFIEPSIEKYDQGGGEFVSHLSILDVLFFNSKEKVKTMLGQFHLMGKPDES